MQSPSPTQAQSLPRHPRYLYPRMEPCICYSWWTSHGTSSTHSPQFTLGLALMLHILLGCDKYIIMTCIHHYRIMHNSFTALTAPYGSPTHLFFLPNLQRLQILLPSPQFYVFPNVTELESYSIWPFQTDFFHLAICI